MPQLKQLQYIFDFYTNHCNAMYQRTSQPMVKMSLNYIEVKRSASSLKTSMVSVKISSLKKYKNLVCTVLSCQHDRVLVTKKIQKNLSKHFFKTKKIPQIQIKIYSTTIVRCTNIHAHTKNQFVQKQFNKQKKMGSEKKGDKPQPKTIPPYMNFIIGGSSG